MSASARSVRSQLGTAASHALSQRERARFAELERVVERGVQTFIEVGLALTEIRDLRLYREHYASFETYLAGAWQLGRSTGYGLIDAARVAANVPLEGQRLSLSQLRVLAPLDIEGQRELAPVVAEMTVAEARRVIRRWRAQQRQEWAERPTPPLPTGVFRTWSSTRRSPTRPTSATASQRTGTRR